MANNQQYLNSLGKNSIPFTIEILSKQDRVNEYIMTALRTSKGLDLNYADQLSVKASEEILKEASLFLNKNWLKKTNQHLTLTREGKLYADYIAGQLFL